MRNSIRSQLTIAFIGVAIGPLLLVGLVLAWQSFNVQQQQARDLESAVAQRVSTRVDAFMQRLEGELLVASKDLRYLAPDQQIFTLSSLPSYPQVFQELTLLDTDGNEQIRLSRLSVVTNAKQSSHSLAPEFTTPKNTNKTYYGPVQFDEETGEPSLTISVPMYNKRTGQVDGVLVGNVRFKEIWDLIASIRVTGGESVYIVDTSGRVVAHLNPSIVLRGTRFDVPAQDGITTGLNKTSVVLASSTLHLNDQVLTVVAEKPVAEALALAIQTVIITAVLLVVAIALASGQGVVAARRLVRPIQSLASTAQALTVKTEAFDPELLSDVIKRHDELGQLAKVFQNMGVEVQTREQNLKQQVQDLRIEIDDAKKKQQVAEITETEYFRELQDKARRLRKQPKDGSPEKA